jgi:hypothetical protein
MGYVYDPLNTNPNWGIILDVNKYVRPRRKLGYTDSKITGVNEMVSRTVSVLKSDEIGDYIKCAYYETIADRLASIYLYLAKCGHIPKILTPFTCEEVLD